MSIMADGMSATLYVMNESETMGIRISRAMEQRGINQSDIARALSVSRMTVHQWVKDISEPKPENLLTLAHFLGTDARYLVFGASREPEGGFPTASSIDDGPNSALRRRKT